MKQYPRVADMFSKKKKKKKRKKLFTKKLKQKTSTTSAGQILQVPEYTNKSGP